MTDDANTNRVHWDKNNDNEISWDEYLQGQYGNLSMEAIQNSSDHNEIIEFVTDDKFRFNVADFDKNGKLSLKELKAFVRPHSHVEMLDYEVHKALLDYDKNGDKSITKSEFIETQYGKDKLNKFQQSYVKTLFDKYDIDNNERLSESEIKKWLHPDITGFAQTEAQYLIKVSDKDGDQRLTKDEVIDKFGHWVNSRATNYGENLKQEL